MKTSNRFPHSTSAFNRLELLSVVAASILLAGLVLPALSASKGRIDIAGCLSNLRHLQNGWRIYMADNNDVMIPSGPIGVPANESWYGSSAANGENWENASGNTNVASYLSSLISPYIQSNILVFKCPGDVVPSANGQRIRSYSMNGQMGAIYTGLLNQEANPGYRSYVHGSDLNCPTPGNAMIFIDESPDTINDGYFAVSLGTPRFPDVPADYLEGGAGMSFADGHAIVHLWQTTALMLPVSPGVMIFGVGVATNNADWLWFAPLTACRN